MKKLILLFVLFPVFAFSMHHKSDPIIFYLDLKVKNNSVNIVESTERLVRVIVNREEERLSKNLSLLATIRSSSHYLSLIHI